MMRLISLTTYNVLLVVALVSLIALISSRGTRVAQTNCQTCTYYANHVTQSPICFTEGNTGDGFGFRYGQPFLVVSSSQSPSVSQTVNIIMQRFSAWQSLVLKTLRDYHPIAKQTVTPHVAQSCEQRRIESVSVHTSFKPYKTDTLQDELSQLT